MDFMYFFFLPEFNNDSTQWHDAIILNEMRFKEIIRN